MDKKTVKVAGDKVRIPAYYERAKDVPDEFKGKQVYAVQTENAFCVVLLSGIKDDGDMIYDQGVLIHAFHEVLLDDNQGLIEVGDGELDGRPYVYSIIKTLMEEDGAPMGVQYNMSMDIAKKKGSTHVQGFFTEQGVTGMRDSMVFAMRSNELGGMDAAMEGWAADPYDSQRQAGALMNLSEQEEFDSLFPEHPLSMARALVRCVLGQDVDDEPEAIRVDGQDQAGGVQKPVVGAAGKLFGKAAKAAGGAAGKAAKAAGGAAGRVADAAGGAASKVADAAGGVASAAAETAGGAIDAVGAKVEKVKEAKDEPDDYDRAVIEYNTAYTDLSDLGFSLRGERIRSIDLIDHVEMLVNSIANHPKSFDVDFGEITAHKHGFKEAEEFARAELVAARKSATSAGAGVAVGMAVASLAPSAALWTATTFGTASTGVAISTLSGAAARQAALAWLGGGAIVVGGGGTAAGNALLALAGPVGWGIAGATLLTSIVLFKKKQFDIRDEREKELASVKRNTEIVAEMTAVLDALFAKTSMLREKLNGQYSECMAAFGADFSELDAASQDRLAAMVNNTLSLARLLNERIEQERVNGEPGEE